MAAPGSHVGTGGGRGAEEENGEGEGEGEEEEEEEQEEEEEEAEAALRAVFPRDPALFSELFPERRRFRLCGRVLHIAEHHGPRLGPAGAVWEAALSLCRFLGEQNLELAGRRGPGAGGRYRIVGIFAAMLGAEVTLTDRPPVLPQLRENARRNFPGGAGAPRVRALRWGRDQRRFPPKFHLILGSDIVYDPRAFAPLLGTLRHLLVPPARALLSARLRGGDAGASRFFRQMLPPFFGVRLLRREPEGDIEIYAVTPREGGGAPPGQGRGGAARPGVSFGGPGGGTEED
ncbi:EEF1A lysine methyltransferase 3 [Poecile atricapillus]|uniref:EEF1A lysine methyltransferase 3 n=1 Tax=Poecile atricapillus TaxID=48891 RepID=UPI0027383637|nr:EEF1A lysine methyltransferase 3 [Poecile atricapillus]